MAKKETLMCVAKCKRKDGKIADYYVHRSAGGGVMIIGPNLERYRCHPGFPNAEAARIEIARFATSTLYQSPVLEVSGALSGNKINGKRVPYPGPRFDMQCP
jgi:hypothetical protein